MKARIFTFTATVFIALFAFGQASAILDINDVHVTFFSDGRIGTPYPSTGVNGYEVPAGSGVHALYTAVPWIGGLDMGGALHLAGERFGMIGDDYWSGPLDSTGSISSSTAAIWDEVFVITRTEVDAFLGGATPTANILNWPAHGDVSLGQDFYLAPFYDVDQDGTYDPVQGDYPCFPGDKALYFIFNDARVHTATGGAQLGVEIRGMAYAFDSSDPAMDQTVFMHYTIVNQSTDTYEDTYLGMFADFDLGNPGDDYIGSDVSRGIMYVYNGDDLDEPSIYGPGYGQQPPALGVTMLQGPLADADGLDNPFTLNVQNAIDSSGIPYAGYGLGYGDGIVDNERAGLSGVTYTYNNGSAQGAPTSAVEYYGYMHGLWRDNTPFLYDGTGHISDPVADSNQTAAFVFPDMSDPFGFSTGGNGQTPWSEEGLMNIPGDRRAVGSSGSFTLEPGEHVEVDYAFVYARASSGGASASVVALQHRTDSIRDFFISNGLYDGLLSGCNSVGVGISDQEDDGLGIEIYPIPALDMITVSMSNTLPQRDVAILDLTGKVVSGARLAGFTTDISIAHLERGVYLLSIPSEEGATVYRFIKQ